MPAESRKPQSISSLTLKNPAYLRLKLALDQQADLLAAVRKQIPAELASACYHALIRDRMLVLYVESAAWASRLRYLTPRLLSALRSAYPGLQSVQIRVRPPGAGRPSDRRIDLSRMARSVLADAAKGVVDTDLSAALARLSRLERPGD